MTDLTPLLALNIGNVLYLLAYSVRDILWLRILTVMANLFLIIYYYSCPTGAQYAAIGWNSLFTAVNIVQIVLLILERRPVFFAEDELRIYRTIFHTLKPREFSKLLEIADRKKAGVGDKLLEQGKLVTELLLISSGSGTVELDGRHVAEVAAGQFVGEMGFLTEQEASARVTASVPTEYLAWPTEELRALLIETPELHVKVQGILGTDMVAKLRKESMEAAHPSRFMTAFRDKGLE